MSHRAMSIPLMTWVSVPPLPSQKVARWSFSLTRSGSSAFSSFQCGRSTFTAARASSSLVDTLPYPMSPSSV